MVGLRLTVETHLSIHVFRMKRGSIYPGSTSLGRLFYKRMSGKEEGSDSLGSSSFESGVEPH